MRAKTISSSPALSARNAGPTSMRTATATPTYVASRMRVDRMAALPGVPDESVVSSLRLTADSQPQYANTPSRSAEVSAAVPAAKGLIHSRLGVAAPGRPWPLAPL